ncbi:putative non-specific serine/threonine protein kinase [Helianthus annuus]|nr:putative non-specific serine/threonine protein kinase [Helianthus annuus]
MCLVVSFVMDYVILTIFNVNQKQGDRDLGDYMKDRIFPLNMESLMFMLWTETIARYGTVLRQLYGQPIWGLYTKWFLSPTRLVFWVEFSCLVCKSLVTYYQDLNL